MMYRIATIIFVLFVIGGTAFAGDCQRTGSVCIDATPCKTVSGQQVCLSQFGLSCWKYEDTYTCLKPNAVNYCQPLINAGCRQTSSQCSQMDTLLGSGCMRYTQTYRCGNPSMPTPSNTVRLNDTYTLVSSNYNPGPCQSLANNSNCTIAEEKCVQTYPDTPLPPGISSSQVAPDGCYKKEQTYACLTGKVSDDCASLASNPNCTLQSEAPCSSEDMFGGKCLYQEKTYKCQTQPPQTKTVTDCSGKTFCQDGKCFDTRYQNDADFAKAAALMEAAREAGVYNLNGAVFSGVDSRCKIKLFGLANCCKKSGGGGGMSNAAMAVSAAGKAASFFGSPYMYDAMFASDVPWLVERAVDAWSATAWTSTTSFYGLQFSFSPLTGLQFVRFDPTSFAIQVGLMILQDLMSCGQQEQILAMRRGQNLCVEVGTYCSKKVLKICVERTKSFCCYNSRLARIINVQGKAQIGKSFGSPESPNCSGFTSEEFSMIDFSKIDLSEFVSEIMANVKMPNLQNLQQNTQGVVQQKMQNYYQKGTQR